jgi:ABC-type multidrug transport system ATPase subunit
MKLTFSSEYLSIKEFPQKKLEKFSLITGVNGSGKTHLLKAIDNGSINVDILQNRTESIYYDFNSLFPKNSELYNGISFYEQRDEIIETLKLSFRDNISVLKRIPSIFNREKNKNYDIKSIEKIKKDDIESLIKRKEDVFSQMEDDIHAVDHSMDQLKTAIKLATGVKKNISTNYPLFRFNDLDKLCSEYPFKIFFLGSENFERIDVKEDGDLFNFGFSELFLKYFKTKNINRLRHLDQIEKLGAQYVPFSNEEFEQTHGKEPWKIVNQIFDSARIDLKINHPNDYGKEDFIAKITKKSTDVDIEFSHLSSGEKIICCFAISLFNFHRKEEIFSKPKLLLLDEIDAPLHPSMSRQIVDIIRDVLVEGQGVNVIMATHSPSTIAVAPKDAIFMMRPGEPGLHKVSQNEAISALTTEIPTLSIDYSGRRQVFVESGYDAARYEKLYRCLKTDLNSERSLSFVSTGPRKKEEKKENGPGGCEVVRRIVRDLVDNGNKSVFGLIDWDKKNEIGERVFVLAKDKRYAIENCLLDPLLVGALAIYTDREWAHGKGIAIGRTYVELAALDDDEIQATIDAVERHLFELSADQHFGERSTVKYFGGKQASISDSYLTMNGHELEGRIKQKFEIFRIYHNDGQIISEIIGKIITDYKQYTPIELIDSFNSILKLDV